MTVATRLKETVEHAKQELSKLHSTAEPPAKVDVEFSKVQRQYLAGVCSDSADLFAIGQTGMRSVSLTVETLIELAATLESQKPTLSGSQKNAATKSLKAIDKAVRSFSDRVSRVGLVYRLRIELDRTDPSVWRQFTVPDCALFDLHDAIQVVMGWEDAHMFAFAIEGTEYFGSPIGGSTGGGQGKNAEEFLLSEVLGKRTKTFRYEYDFGDSWIHTVTVEDAATSPHFGAAKCLAGENACPPEDCGGVYGFFELVQAIQDPDVSADDDERLEWHEGFDPCSFSVQRVSARLASLFK